MKGVCNYGLFSVVVRYLFDVLRFVFVFGFSFPKEVISVKKLCFAVYDHKAGLFNAPFLCVNVDSAVRMTQMAMRDAQSPIGAFPGDFSLHRVGVFEDTSGFFEMTSEKGPELVATGLQIFSLMKGES